MDRAAALAATRVWRGAIDPQTKTGFQRFWIIVIIINDSSNSNNNSSTT